MIESLRKKLHAVDHQFVRHLIDGDARPVERGHLLFGLVDICFQCGANLSVIAKRIQRRGRKRVDRIRGD